MIEMRQQQLLNNIVLFDLSCGDNLADSVWSDDSVASSISSDQAAFPLTWGEQEATPPLWSVLPLLWLKVRNIVAALASFPHGASIKTNWSRTVSKLHCLVDFFSAFESLFFTPEGEGSWSVNKQNGREDHSNLNWIKSTVWHSGYCRLK